MINTSNNKSKIFFTLSIICIHIKTRQKTKSKTNFQQQLQQQQLQQQQLQQLQLQQLQPLLLQQLLAQQHQQA